MDTPLLNCTYKNAQVTFNIQFNRNFHMFFAYWRFANKRALRHHHN